jgi:hypothetical protein
VFEKREKENSMFYGQTTNLSKQVKEVTQNGMQSVPHIASQCVQGNTAIRVSCGAELHVQLRADFYISLEQLQQFELFLESFNLPRNGYQVIDTRQPYQQSYAAYPANSDYSAPLPIAPPNP